MPYCNLPGRVRLHYKVSGCETLADRDPYLPILLLLPPQYLDVSFLDTLWTNEYLNDNFTLIAIDPRGSGHTTAPNRVEHSQDVIWRANS